MVLLGAELLTSLGEEFAQPDVAGAWRIRPVTLLFPATHRLHLTDDV